MQKQSGSPYITQGHAPKKNKTSRFFLTACFALLEFEMFVGADW
jgi:hypothetical protein